MDKTAHPERDLQNDLLWIELNRECLWEHFADQWIAVFDQCLVGTGPTPSIAVEEARLRGIDNPLVSGVEAREYQGVIMLRSPRIVRHQQDS